MVPLNVDPAYPRTPRPGDAVRFNKGTWVSMNPRPVATAIPLTPTDGDSFIYQPDTDTDWEFKYDASTLFWRFVGGPSLIIAAAGVHAVGTASTWLNASSPSYTIPFSGSYNLKGGFHTLANNTAAASNMSAAVFVNGAQASPTCFNAVTQNTSVSGQAVSPKAAATAGQVADFRYQSSQTTNNSFSDLWLEVTPVKIH